MSETPASLPLEDDGGLRAPPRTASPSEPLPRRGLSARAIALLLFPALAWLAMVSEPVLRAGRIEMAPFDVALAAIVVAHLALGAALAPRPRAFRRFLLATYSVLVPLAVVELALVLVVAPRIPRAPWGARSHVITQAADTMPGISGKIEITTNSIGVRGREVDFAETDVAVLCLGGSTTECLFVSDKDTWPWQLEEKLAAKMKKRVFVGNGGRSGQLVLHAAYQLSYWPLAPKFPVVVLLAGINDLGAHTRLLESQLSYEDRKARIAAEALAPAFDRSTFYRRSRIFQIVSERASRAAPAAAPGEEQVVMDLAGQWHASQRIARRRALQAKTLREPPAGLDEAVRDYEVDLARVVDIARAHGQRLVLLTQPSMYRKDLPPELDALLWWHHGMTAYTPEVLEKMLDRFNQAMLRVAKETGTDCLDLASMLPKDTTVFYDDCHFNVSGCAKVSDALAAFLAERLAR